MGGTVTKRLRKIARLYKDTPFKKALKILKTKWNILNHREKGVVTK